MQYNCNYKLLSQPPIESHLWEKDCRWTAQSGEADAGQPEKGVDAQSQYLLFAHVCMCVVKTMGTVGTWEHYPLTRAIAEFLRSHNR